MRNIISSVIGVLCVYLLGAFVEAGFNIVDWAIQTRFGVALFMPVGAAFGLAISLQGKV
jgi:CBS-domain-containing membrane protein